LRRTKSTGEDGVLRLGTEAVRDTSPVQLTATCVRARPKKGWAARPSNDTRSGHHSSRAQGTAGFVFRRQVFLLEGQLWERQKPGKEQKNKERYEETNVFAMA